MHRHRITENDLMMMYLDGKLNTLEFYGATIKAIEMDIAREMALIDTYCWAKELEVTLR